MSDTDPRAARPRLPRTAPSAHPLMSVGEAAQTLGFSHMTIRRAIDSRQFPALKMGSKALVPRAFVERLLAEASAGNTVIVEEAAGSWVAEGVA